MSEEKKEEKKGISKFLIVGLLVFLLIVFAGVSFVVYSMFFADSQDEKVNIGPIFDAHEYTVNLLEAGGKKYLRTKFSTEVDNKKVLAELELKLPMFHDTVNRVLGNQTLAELEVPGAKEKIAAQLIGALNEILDSGEVTNIFFEEFVWQ